VGAKVQQHLVKIADLQIVGMGWLRPGMGWHSTLFAFLSYLPAIFFSYANNTDTLKDFKQNIYTDYTKWNKSRIIKNVNIIVQFNAIFV